MSRMIPKVGAYAIAYAAETANLATHNLRVGLYIRTIANKGIANHSAAIHDIMPLELRTAHDRVGIKMHLVPQFNLLRKTVKRI